MTEKEKIEKVTAEKFLKLYNNKFNTMYIIKEISDHPDVLCEDLSGNKLSLEITLTEDCGNDIKALLGRSEHKDLAYVKEHGMGTARDFVNVSKNALQRIREKMRKDYGANVALVVRDVSPLDWDWNDVLDKKLDDIKNPFEKGIWILTCGNPNKIYQIL